MKITTIIMSVMLCLTTSCAATQITELETEVASLTAERDELERHRELLCALSFEVLSDGSRMYLDNGDWINFDLGKIEYDAPYYEQCKAFVPDYERYLMEERQVIRRQLEGVLSAEALDVAADVDMPIMIE